MNITASFYKFIIFSMLIVLSACNPPGNRQYSITTVDTVLAIVQSSSEKISGEQRKKNTNALLKQKGIPILEGLPLVEDYTTAHFRDEREVARKAVVLYGLIFVANKEKTAEEIISYFKKYSLWERVSPEERKYLVKKDKTDRDNNPVSWRLENLNVLLWSLGHFAKMPFPTQTCDFSNYENLPNLDADPTGWINRARLRNKEEILDETDLIYRLNWATDDARLNHTKVPGGLNDDVIMERHFALNWLTMYAENWDDITTDT